jgi:hypothetical protein
MMSLLSVFAPWATDARSFGMSNLRMLAVACAGLAVLASAESQMHSKRPFNPGSRAPSDEIAFRFTLPESKVTSAAVYDSRGTKIRDLWGGRRLAAGTYNEVWDGKDEDGVQMPTGNYTIKLLHHNLRFEYTNLFNAGIQPTGVGSYFQFGQPRSVRAGGNNLVWFCDYNEGGTATFKSNTQKPLAFELNLAPASSQWTTLDGSLDADYGYVAVKRNSYWSTRPQDTYLMKFNVRTNAQVPFSGLVSDGLNLGSGIGPGGANYSGYAVSCGVNVNTSDRTFEIAKVTVMHIGNVVAVAQPNANRVLFFNKTTGLTARAPLSVPKPTAICWTRNEANLIVVSNGSVLKSYRDVGSALLPMASLDQRNYIVDVASDPVSGNVAVAFASPVQQVVAFEPTQLRERWRLGKLGGYASTAVVAPDRFHFTKFANGGSLSFQPDGKLWVYDRALYRMQRFTRPNLGATVDQTMHIADHYVFAADPNDGSRLSANYFLGYRRDWSKKNLPGFGGQGAWLLDRFWGYRYVDAYDVPGLGGIQQMFSYAGRLYGWLRYEQLPKLVELTSTGVREIAVLNKSFGLDGNMDRYSRPTVGVITREPFQGVNGSGNPIWGAPQTYATYNANSTVDPIPTPGQGTTEYPVVDGKVITAYHMLDTNPARYHVGALNPDGSWAWRHGRPQEESVPFPKNGRTTTIGNIYAIQGVWAKDDFAVLSWNGEFYDAGQAGKHLIYNREGMYVDQVGHSSVNSSISLSYPAAGTNGNAVRAALLHEGGKYRYLHSTESQTSGILEWTFENMESYGVASKTGALGSSIVFNAIPSMGEVPQPPGSIIEEDSFQRPNSSSLGTGWNKLNGYDGLVIENNALVGKIGVYSKTFENIAYRTQSELDSCQTIRIPQSFFAPNHFGQLSTSGFNSRFGLVARLQPTSKSLLMAYVRYDRSANVAPGSMLTNGSIKLEILATDGIRQFSLATLSAKFLPASPGSAYSLRFVVKGTQPTRIEALLWDDTRNQEVLRTYTESWEPMFELAGHGGISVGVEKVRITRYEKRQFTWPVQ